MSIAQSTTLFAGRLRNRHALARALEITVIREQADIRLMVHLYKFQRIATG
jgi:hypothetical protein